jgi:hypothetical protein
MSTLIVAFIIVGSVTAICYLLISIHNKNKRKALSRQLSNFSLQGTNHNLSFSSQEILQDCVIGLDGVNRKIMLVHTNNHDDCRIINLNNVKSCSVQKLYGMSGSGNSNKKLEKYLERITLRLELVNGQPVEILFYNNLENHIYEITELEQKARQWETMLAKMQPAVLKMS